MTCATHQAFDLAHTAHGSGDVSCFADGDDLGKRRLSHEECHGKSPDHDSRELRPLIAEGTFQGGKREGAGRYDWPAGQRYQGTYKADFPNGWGTVTIEGKSFAGTWQRGCLAYGDKLIAIGVLPSACSAYRPMSKVPSSKPGSAFRNVMQPS